MTVNLTSDQILAMAPDASSAKSGKELSIPRKWVSLGFNESSAWGECQGSGSSSYQTRVDLTEIAFKCSCPSRKFPCKHSLALLLLLVENEASFTQKDAPQWVSEWLASRTTRTEKKAKKAEEVAEKPVDAAAQAKRAAQRKQKVDGGIAELDRWMQDVVRQGLAAVQQKPYSFWEGMAARLVDAQAPGMARLVRDCAGIPSTGQGWQERLLERLGRLYLVVEAYSRIDSLPPNLQEELRAVIGFTVNQDELIASNAAVLDTWEIVGQSIEHEDKLRVQRTWLYGRETQRWGLVLNFAHGTAPLDGSLVPGRKVAAELVFFPGSFPLRAVVKPKPELGEAVSELPGVRVTSALSQFSEALAKNPWVERFPISLEDVIPVHTDGNWLLVDKDQCALPMFVRQMTGWQMVSLSGGQPISVFGEFDGTSMTPLTVSANKSLVRLS